MSISTNPQTERSSLLMTKDHTFEAKEFMARSYSNPNGVTINFKTLFNKHGSDQTYMQQNQWNEHELRAALNSRYTLDQSNTAYVDNINKVRQVVFSKPIDGPVKSLICMFNCFSNEIEADYHDDKREYIFGYMQDKEPSSFF